MENKHTPIFCTNCRTPKRFELYSKGNITTESGQSFMLGYKCRVCGKVVVMTNPDYLVAAVLHPQ